MFAVAFDKQYPDMEMMIRAWFPNATTSDTEFFSKIIFEDR